MMYALTQEQELIAQAARQLCERQIKPSGTTSVANAGHISIAYHRLGKGERRVEGDRSNRLVKGDTANPTGKGTWRVQPVQPGVARGFVDKKDLSSTLMEMRRRELNAANIESEEQARDLTELQMKLEAEQAERTARLIELSKLHIQDSKAARVEQRRMKVLEVEEARIRVDVLRLEQEERRYQMECTTDRNKRRFVMLSLVTGSIPCCALVFAGHWSMGTLVFVCSTFLASCAIGRVDKSFFQRLLTMVLGTRGRSHAA